MDKATPVVTVTQLNNFIKDCLDTFPALNRISVKGEISNITLHKTGHIYLTLKDEGGVLKTVMFRADAAKLPFVPKNGDKVIVTGRISVFVRDGIYQLYATSMELDGIGSLYIAFEKLKAKLASQGLFDVARKRKLPSVPLAIGIVTAPTGAAIRDMINISGRRFPPCEIILYPSLVQGSGAAQNIIKGIEYFNKTNRAEIIVIGRGGGSIEDLWAFNDEELAHAIYNSRIPVISAVGHETDFTIADFVADLRAPTPSAAMEIALPDIKELLHKFENVRSRISLSLSKRLDGEKRLLKMLASSAVLTTPERLYQDKMLELSRLSENLEDAVTVAVADRAKNITSLSSLLNSYNPLGVLKRGYSVAFDGEGKIISAANQIDIGEGFTLKLSDGSISAVRTGEEYGKENL
ncbi:MAG: exodeoxyribonuclease VII large subunit [Clostridiales bacterium]|jgi:exodeoxyribonuclease VII large subunit|nr:exodeoxyribonuclease VII large subunit [Clostridiales bacterium]